MMPPGEESNPYSAPKSPLTPGSGQRYVRIVAVPPGEAPEEVRRAWVGLTLPLVPRLQDRQEFRGAGVLTGPRTVLGWLVARFTGRTARHRGYAVEGRAAVAVLGEHAPEAAEWWRSNVPEYLRPGRMLLFAEEVCQELP